MLGRFVVEMQVLAQDVAAAERFIRHVAEIVPFGIDVVQRTDVVNEHNARAVVGCKQLVARIRNAVRFILADRDRRLLLPLSLLNQRQHAIAAEIDVRGMRASHIRVIATIVIDRTESDRAAVHREAAEEAVHSRKCGRSFEFRDAFRAELERGLRKHAVAQLAAVGEVAEVDRAALKSERAREVVFALLARERKFVVRRGKRHHNAATLKASLTVRTVLQYAAEGRITVHIAGDREKRILGHLNLIARFAARAAEKVAARCIEMHPGARIKHEVAQEVALRADNREVGRMILVVDVSAADNLQRADAIERPVDPAACGHVRLKRQRGRVGFARIARGVLTAKVEATVILDATHDIVSVDVNSTALSNIKARSRSSVGAKRILIDVQRRAGSHRRGAGVAVRRRQANRFRCNFKIAGTSQVGTERIGVVVLIRRRTAHLERPAIIDVDALECVLHNKVFSTAVTTRLFNIYAIDAFGNLNIRLFRARLLDVKANGVVVSNFAAVHRDMTVLRSDVNAVKTRCHRHGRAAGGVLREKRSCLNVRIRHAKVDHKVATKLQAIDREMRRFVVATTGRVDAREGERTRRHRHSLVRKVDVAHDVRAGARADDKLRKLRPGKRRERTAGLCLI